MSIEDFMKKNEIAIVAQVDINKRIYNIIKREICLESYNLFEQLILWGNIDNLIANLQGQLMPRIWTQGKTKCVLCQPNNDEIVALFYDSSLDVKEHYFFAKQLDAMIKEILK